DGAVECGACDRTGALQAFAEPDIGGEGIDHAWNEHLAPARIVLGDRDQETAGGGADIDGAEHRGAVRLHAPASKTVTPAAIRMAFRTGPRRPRHVSPPPCPPNRTPAKTRSSEGYAFATKAVCDGQLGPSG